MPSTHVSIAWFKLAECIRRGEKERSLSVYRLLIHSLKDEAVAYQLKGDLLATFHMHEEAAHAYHAAAQIFEKQQREFQAAYAHECVIVHNPRWYHNYHILVAWYTHIGVVQRAQTIAQELLRALINDGYISRAYETLHTYVTYFSRDDVAYLYELFIQHALEKSHGSADRAMIHTGIAKAIDVYRDMHDESSIQTLFDTLARTDSQAYQYAQHYHENG